MFILKNGTNVMSVLHAGSHNKFRSYGGKGLKRNLTGLHCTRYNEIYAFHLYIQNHITYKTKWHKH